MGLRFRKSIKLGGLRINFSKSGIGHSYGVKGLRYTKTANGKDRITASIPGTGISYVEERARKKRKGSSTQPVVPEPKKNYRIPLAIKALAVLCGIGFVAYYMVQGWEMVTALCSGALMGGLSYLALSFLYGAAAEAVGSLLHKDVSPAQNDDPEEK